MVFKRNCYQHNLWANDLVINITYNQNAHLQSYIIINFVLIPTYSYRHFVPKYSLLIPICSCRHFIPKYFLLNEISGTICLRNFTSWKYYVRNNKHCPVFKTFSCTNICCYDIGHEQLGNYSTYYTPEKNNLIEGYEVIFQTCEFYFTKYHIIMLLSFYKISIS